MNPSSVIRSRVNCDKGAGFPSMVSTWPSGACMIRWSLYVPGSGGTKSSGGRGSSDARARAGRAAGPTSRARPVSHADQPDALLSARRGIGGTQHLRAQLHVVGAPELLPGEVHLEDLRQLLAVPGEASQELFVVGAAL